MIIYDSIRPALGDDEKTRHLSVQVAQGLPFSAGQLSRLRKNENISTYTINTLCKILDCKIEDVAVYLEEDASETEEQT